MLYITKPDRNDEVEQNIIKYKAFLKTVECGSFSEAAEVLSYSQSGISRMIHDLEKECEVILVERGKQGVKLTSEGMTLLPHIQMLCNEFDKTQMKIDEMKGIQSGIIRIGTFSSVATHWLPNIVQAFQKDYPKIDYELLLGDYTEIEGWIAEGRIDFGFLCLPALAEFDTIEIAKDQQMVVLPKNHPLAGFECFPVKKLIDYPFMLLEKGAKAEISQIFEKNNLNLKPKFTTWDDYAIMSMVEKGLGIAILPELILKRIPYEILVKPLDTPAYRTIGIAMKNKKGLSVAANKFIEYIVSKDGI